jgi:hypothetical protein
LYAYTTQYAEKYYKEINQNAKLKGWFVIFFSFTTTFLYFTNLVLFLLLGDGEELLLKTHTQNKIKQKSNNKQNLNDFWVKIHISVYTAISSESTISNIQYQLAMSSY